MEGPACSTTTVIYMQVHEQRVISSALARNSKLRSFCLDWEDVNVTERKFANLQLKNKFLRGDPQNNTSYFSSLRFRNWLKYTHRLVTRCFPLNFSYLWD